MDLGGRSPVGRLRAVDDLLGVRRNERDTLAGFLDWYRSVVEGKVGGLSEVQARTMMTPTGLSPLGVVKHLGWVERGWFREIFAGEDVEAIDVPGDNSAEFRLEKGEDTAAIIAFYREEVDHARRIASGTPSLDSLSARETRLGEHVSLRWVMVHMIEETARHVGHLDLMRERIDGRTGD